MGTLSRLAHRFLSDPYGTAIQAVIFLVFLAVGVGLIVAGMRYAISLFKEISGK